LPRDPASFMHPSWPVFVSLPVLYAVFPSENIGQSGIWTHVSVARGKCIYRTHYCGSCLHLACSIHAVLFSPYTGSHKDDKYGNKWNLKEVCCYVIMLISTFFFSLCGLPLPLYHKWQSGVARTRKEISDTEWETGLPGLSLGIYEYWGDVLCLL
jgi:hypothetical protein